MATSSPRPVPKTYTYDGDGRTATVVCGGVTTTLSYDYESRLTSLAYSGGSTYTYSYNGLATRVGKNEGTSQTYRRDGASVTAPVLSDRISHFTPGVSQHITATTFNHADQLGSFVAQTTSSQAVTDTQQFDAFGLLLSSTGTRVGPFGFVGGEGYQTDASGLQLLGHRYYDSSTGRFVTSDPAQAGRNWYGYAYNNPLTTTDSNGLDGGKGKKNVRHTQFDDWSDKKVVDEYERLSKIPKRSPEDDEIYRKLKTEKKGRKLDGINKRQENYYTYRPPVIDPVPVARATAWTAVGAVVIYVVVRFGWVALF